MSKQVRCRLVLSVFVFVCTLGTACAQKVVVDFLKRRYNRVTTDTNYIQRPKTYWTVKPNLRFARRETDWSGMLSGCKEYGFEDDVMPARVDFKPTGYTSLGIGANFSIIGLNLTLLPGNGKNDFEIQLRIYNNLFGIEVGYEQNRKMDGTFSIGDYFAPMQSIGIKQAIFNFNGFYVFNNRRFSMPAALIQNYIQRRSAGSFLVGMTFCSADMNFDGFRDPDGVYPEMRALKLGMRTLGLGAGYGYNIVPAQNWLIHVSTIPTLIVYSHDFYVYDNEKTRMKAGFPDYNINTQVSAVYNFSRYFAAATFWHNLMDLGKKDDAHTRTSKFNARLTFGVRF